MSFWRRALRAGIAFIIFPALALAIAFTCAKIVAQSDQWELPSGRLLDTVLSSCQFEHMSSTGVDVEHMICPTRLGAGEFPQVLKNAVIASEDERFFSHGAIDFPSTARAAWHFSLGDRQGGSTITQQFARSILLKKEDSLERKLVEAVLAIRIFARLSRSEILTRYMNVVPHARNMYGFDDPARYYFGVGVQELNLPEAALLVGMLPEPNNRDPLKTSSAAIEGAVTVLERMVGEGMITVDQAVRAENELKRRIKTGKLSRGSKLYARLEYRAYRDLALREARANGIKLPEDYRLIVFIDPEFQQTLQTQICSITGMYQGAGFFMRPSGEALALTGSCAYTGEWNRATDIARSIGSTGKLFPLIGVHEAGWSLNERFSTWPLRRSSWPAEPNPLCRQRAKVSLEFALAQSCNRPWTEVSMRLGQRVIDIVRRFDITPPNAPSLVPIGGVQTSPMKLAQAYAALENDGMLPQIRFLSAVIGPRGNLIGLPVRKDGPRVMSSATASSVLQALRGPVKRGTARGANSAHALVYGKTGTSSRNEDALFVGLTQDFVGSIWLGHDRPAP
ncbi:MAG TPA: transglycosylase domain-containing protein, partial [Methyloceanibacter sp.]